MKTLRIGNKILFNNKREEKIIHTKNPKSRKIGKLTTKDINGKETEYSVDFIKRWIDFGFCKII